MPSIPLTRPQIIYKTHPTSFFVNTLTLSISHLCFPLALDSKLTDDIYIHTNYTSLSNNGAHSELPWKPIAGEPGDFSVGREGMRIFDTVRWVDSVRLRAMALTPGAFNVPAVAIEWVVGQLLYFDIPHRVVMSYDVL